MMKSRAYAAQCAFDHCFVPHFYPAQIVSDPLLDLRIILVLCGLALGHRRAIWLRENLQPDNRLGLRMRFHLQVSAYSRLCYYPSIAVPHISASTSSTNPAATSPNSSCRAAASKTGKLKRPIFTDPISRRDRLRRFFTRCLSCAPTQRFSSTPASDEARCTSVLSLLLCYAWPYHLKHWAYLVAKSF